MHELIGWLLMNKNSKEKGRIVSVGGNKMYVSYIFRAVVRNLSS